MRIKFCNSACGRMARYFIILLLLAVPSILGSIDSEYLEENSCGSRDCQHGICVEDAKRGAWCNCTVGFIGESCQFEDPCELRHRRHAVHVYGSKFSSSPAASESMARCQHGGRCVSKVRHGEVHFKCLCPYGFVGADCESVDSRFECHPSRRGACHNGGVCLQSPGADDQGGAESLSTNTTTRCHCVGPYRGPRCECLNGVNTTDGKPCADFVRPQQSHHHAYSSSNAAFSLLRSGKRGQQNNKLSTLQFDCTRTPCENNGTCSYNKSLGGYSCQCDQLKWKGTRCEAQVTCGDNRCQNNSTCLNTNSGYTCICPPGYGGADCSVNTNPCVNCPQTCSRNGNMSMCPCPVGRFGVFCNYTNFCVTNNTCRNNAKCYPFIDGPISNYTCSCPPQFKGRHCEDDIDECGLALNGSRPLCENGGTCVNTYGSYECECPRGFTGARCDMVVDYCEPNPCLNGGTCLDPQGNGLVTCSCLPPYGGATCDSVMTTSSTSRPATSPTTTVSSTTSEWVFNDVMLTCISANCQAANGVCEPHCNSSACNYDNGDCAYGQIPFSQCLPLILNSVRCDLLFKNGVCDPQCDNAACLHDGYDCLFSQRNNSVVNPSIAPPSQCPAACVPLYSNGVCNTECNRPACAYDALDCDARLPFNDYLVLVLNTSYAKFSSDHTLRNSYVLTLSWQLQLIVRVVSVQPISISPPVYSRKKRDTFFSIPADAGTQLTLSLDGSKCYASDCVTSASTAAQMLAAMNLASSSATSQSLPIVSITTQPGSNSGQPRNALLGDPLALAFTSVAALLVAVVITFAVIAVVRKAADSRDDDNRPSTSSGSSNDYDDRAQDSPSRAKVHARLWIPPFPGGFGSQKGGANAFSRGKTASLQSQNSTATIFSNGTGETGASTLAGACGDCGVATVAATGQCHSKRSRLEVPKRNAALRESMYEDEDADDVVDGSCDERASSCEQQNASPSALVSANTACQHQTRRKMHLHVRTQNHGPKGMTKAMVLASRGCGLEVDSQILPEDSISNVLQTDGHGHVHSHAHLSGNSSSQCLATVKSADALRDAIHDMVRNGVSLNARCEPNGETALHLACRFGQPLIVKQLLDCGADANAEDSAGRSPLHTAIASDSCTCFSLLLKHRQTNLNAKTRHDAQTPLIVAVKLAINAEVVNQLIQADVDLNACDASGRTALHWSAAVNNIEAAKQLLKFSANRDAQDQREQTPLFLAAREGSFEVAKVLLEEFANPEIPDCQERTPRQIAVEKQHDNIVHLIDQYASISGSCVRPSFNCPSMQPTYTRGPAAMPISMLSGSSCRNLPQEVAYQQHLAPMGDRRNTMPAPHGNVQIQTQIANAKARQKAAAKFAKTKNSPLSADLTSPSSAFTGNNTPPSVNAFTSASASASNSNSNSPSHRAASIPIPVALNGANSLQLHANRPAQIDHLLQQPSSAGSADSGYGNGSNSISPPHAVMTSTAAIGLPVASAAAAQQGSASASQNSSMSSTPSSVNPPTVINAYAMQTHTTTTATRTFSNSSNVFPRPPPMSVMCVSDSRNVDGQQDPAQYNQSNLALGQFTSGSTSSGLDALGRPVTVANGVQLSTTYSMSVAYAQSTQHRAQQQHQQHMDACQQRVPMRSNWHDSYPNEQAVGQARMDTEVLGTASNSTAISQRYPGFPATYI